MLNVISVDVEEYFHAANLAAVAGPSQWRRLPSRVEISTKKTLELFAKHSARGTFFVLGYCARRYPHLVREIAAAGHEIASHGYGHRIAYRQTPRQFLRDVTIAKKILEDITGSSVHGYRAPNFSITDANPWAYDCLIEAGYKYDSSNYPTWHPRYANLDKPVAPAVIQRAGGKIYSFPLAVAEETVAGKKLRFPVAGGAYWRLLPQSYCLWGLRRINRSGRWFNCYFHPWEIDTDQPRFEDLPRLTKLRHYGGTARFARRIEVFLENFTFTTLAEAAVQSFPEYRV